MTADGNCATAIEDRLRGTDLRQRRPLSMYALARIKLSSIALSAIVVVLTLAGAQPTSAGGLGGLSAAYAVSVAQQSCCVRPQDQVWLVSTRRLGRNANPCSGSVPHLAYYQFCCQSGRWIERSECDFRATHDASVVNTVYVHGNRQRSLSVRNRGFQAYCFFKECVGCRRIRHVIWEWPSMPIPLSARVLRDGRVKLRRTPAQSYYLGWWLQQLPPQLDVRILGYSYGARTTLGALQLLAGGRLEGRCLPKQPWCCTVKPRLALWAAATQADQLCPTGWHNLALSQTRGCLNVYNRSDPVLSRAERAIRRFTNAPLGLCGINLGWPLKNLDGTQCVGPRHSIDFYFQSPSVRQCSCEFLGQGL